VSRSRWHTPVDATKRAVGLLVVLLTISGIWPLPLINVLPPSRSCLLAIAHLQQDGLLLALSFVIGIVALLAFGFLVWTSAGALETFSADCCTCRGCKAERRRLRGAFLSWKRAVFRFGTHLPRSGWIVTAA
jgi:hypothetical protein